MNDDITPGTKYLCDLAEREFTRVVVNVFADIRAKTTFYQTFAAALIAALAYVYQSADSLSTISFVFFVLSGGLFCSALFCAVFSLVGKHYNIVSDVGLLNMRFKMLHDDVPAEIIAGDILEQYYNATNEALDVVHQRYSMLRIVNSLLLIGMVFGGLAISYI